MPELRLPAKLSRPRVYGALARERLFQRLDGFDHASIIWISGPPGAGKTTLASTWLSERRFPSLWYRVDDGDADPATFFSTLNRGAATIKSKSHPTPPYLAPQYHADLPGFARQYFRAPFDRLPRNEALVIDNHENAGGGVFDEILLIAADKVPPDSRIIVTSRVNPPAALAHLTTKGTMATLTWDDLRLSETEARALAKTTPRPWPAGTFDQLFHLSDGWVAGFVALLAHGGVPAPRSPADAKLEPLFQYFVREMYDRANADTRAMLLRTAVMPSFTEAQAIKISGVADAGDILRRLYRLQYFVSRGGGAEPIYQYHALFREFLIQQGRSDIVASERKNLLVAAARELAESGAADSAIDLCVEATAWADATSILRAVSQGMIDQGRNVALQQRLDTFPKTFVEREPWLTYWSGMARLPFAPIEARGLLERAYDSFIAADDSHGALLSCAGVLETYWIDWSNMRPIDRWIEAVKALWRRRNAFPSEDVEIRVLASMGAMYFRLAPHRATVDDVTRRARTLLANTSDPSRRLLLASAIAWTSSGTGSYVTLREILDSEGTRLSSSNLPATHLISWHAVASLSWVEAGRLPDAILEAKRAENLAASTGVGIFRGMIAAAWIYISLHQGQLDAASKWIETRRSALNPARRLDDGHHDHVMSAYWLAQGDAARALSLAQSSIEKIAACGSDFATNKCRETLTAALIELGQHDQAAAETRQLVEFARHAQCPVFEYSGLMLRAYALFRTGAIEDALVALRAGLSIGREHQYLMTPWSLPSLPQTLMPLALKNGIETAWVRRIITQLGIKPPDDNIPLWPWSVRVYALGGFRIEVDDKPVEFGRKVPRRPLAVLKYLISHGGDAPLSQVLDTLWPDDDGDAAAPALDVALHRVRKILGGNDRVQLSDGRLSLDRTSIWVDSFAFEDAATASFGSDTATSIFAGRFLPDDFDQPWTVSARERLHSIFLRAASAQGRVLESARNFESAAAHYQRCIEIDDVAEGFYQGLMPCLLALGRRSEGIAIHGRLTRILSAKMGVSPSAETERFLKSLRQG